MAFLPGIDAIRAVSWGKSYLWDLRFIDADLPAPFNTWFPAQEVEENTANLESFSFDAGYTQYKFPSKGGPRSVRITFIDDANHSLYSWLDNWINKTILNDRKYVASLDKSVKRLEVVKLNHDRQIIRRRSYFVFPEDNLTFRGSSGSELLIYSVNFHVAGITNESQNRQVSTQSRSRPTILTAGNDEVDEPSNSSSIFDFFS